MDKQTQPLPLSERLWTLQGWGLVLITFMSFFPRLFHIEEYLFFTLVVCALGVACWEKRVPCVKSPIDRPLLLLVGWILVSIPFALDPAYSFAEWRKLIAKVLVFYWTLWVMQRQPGGLVRSRVLIAVVIGTALVSGYALADFVSRGGSLENRAIRAVAPSSDFHVLATYLVIAIPIVWGVAVGSRQGWQRMAGWSVGGIAGLALVVSYVRGGWLALVVEALTFGVITARRSVMLGILVLSLVVGLGFWDASEYGYQTETVTPNTLMARIGVWRLGVNEMLAHPLTGIGYGSDTFLLRFRGYPETGRAVHLHNTFLMVAMGSGVPALLGLLWVFGNGYWSLLARVRSLQDRGQAIFPMSVALMLVGLFTMNLFDLMFFGSSAMLFWILLALGLARESEVTH